MKVTVLGKLNVGHFWKTQHMLFIFYDISIKAGFLDIFYNEQPVVSKTTAGVYCVSLLHLVDVT